MPDHPILPSGFNADPIDGDEVDGAGTNWAIWPVLFDSFIGLQPLIISEEMLAVFDGCADIVFRHPDNVIAFPCENRHIGISGEWATLLPPVTSRTLSFPADQREQKIRRRR